MPSPATPLPPSAAELAAVGADCRAFLQGADAVMIASRGGDAEPHISYAPVICDAACHLWLLLSDLADHSANLRAHGRGEVMLIEPAAAARNPFARQRVTLRCRVTEIGRGDPAFAEQLEAMRRRHGETVTLLAGLGDFRLLRLQPEEGRYVQGFGRAWALQATPAGLRVSGRVAR